MSMRASAAGSYAIIALLRSLRGVMVVASSPIAKKVLLPRVLPMLKRSIVTLDTLSSVCGFSVGSTPQALCIRMMGLIMYLIKFSRFAIC